jgi:hypothetical protein
MNDKRARNFIVGCEDLSKIPRTKKKTGRRTLLAAIFIFCLVWGGTVESAEKVTVGLVEEVILLPWGVRIPARVDTGAATSSLDARDISIKGKTVEFSLPQKYGGLRISRPIVAWRTVRSAEAQDERPVIVLQFCLGSQVVRARVNLNDRSQVKYPLLVGRNALKKNFVVDCMKERCAPPTCREVQAK